MNKNIIIDKLKGDFTFQISIVLISIVLIIYTILALPIVVSDGERAIRLITDPLLYLILIFGFINIVIDIKRIAISLEQNR